MVWGWARGRWLVRYSTFCSISSYALNPILRVYKYSIAEISTIQLRATLMSGYQTTLQLSALAGFWIAYASNAILSQDSDLQWQIPVAVQLVPGILLLFGMSVGIVPESPFWLAGKERWGEVERSLDWLRGVDGAGEEVAVLRKASERGGSQEMGDYGEEKVSFWKEALRPAVRKRLGVGIGLMVAQNMVGLNALNYCMSSPSSVLILTIY